MNNDDLVSKKEMIMMTAIDVTIRIGVIAVKVRCCWRVA